MSEWPEEEKEERGEKEEPMILWEEGREEEGLGLILSALVTLSSNILDLSKRNIKILPGKDSFPICPQLEYLYLEGNRLSAIPEALTAQCPALVWLDLRNNNLSSITPAIAELKCLRTLLLEGNKIVMLPYELGNMKKLYGLSLFNNPLEMPPHEIVKKGTKAVLQYLRDMKSLKEDKSTHDIIVEEQQNEGSSGDDDDDDDELGIPSQTQMIKKDENGVFKKRRKQKASIKPKSIVAQSAVLRNRDELKRKTATSPGERGRRRSRKDSKDKDAIDKELNRERSKQSLNDWREETARMKKEGANSKGSSDNGFTAKAPYATSNGEESSGMMTQLSSLSLHSTSSHGSNLSREESDIKVTEWTKEYAKRLKETRENGGVGTLPTSSDLLEAELKLAEALAMRKHFETRHYRLRAFTGDTST